MRYRILLLAAAAIWGLGTVMIKGSVDELGPGWLLGLRFTGAGVVLAVLCLPRLVRLAREGRMGSYMRTGAILGVIVGVAYYLNTAGLAFTTASKSSFLTGVYCIMVPFLSWLFMSRKPNGFNVGAAILCLAGIAFVSLPANGAFNFGVGDGITLISALVLGLQMVFTAKLARGMDMFVLTGVQFLIGGGLVLGLGVATEPVPSAAVLFAPEMVASLVYLVLFASCAAMVLQNVGLVNINPATGALLLSFESVFGVMFSVALLGETLTVSMVIGFCLIFAAVVVSEWLPSSALGSRIAGGFSMARAAEGTRRHVVAAVSRNAFGLIAKAVLRPSPTAGVRTGEPSLMNRMMEGEMPTSLLYRFDSDLSPFAALDNVRTVGR